MQLDDLKGEPVSAIAFVQDYVEIHFDGPVFRCIADPVLRDPEGCVRFPDSGSRDRLCKLIGSQVIDVVIQEDHEIRLSFGGDRTLLVRASNDLPEFAHFWVPGRQPIQIW